MEEDGQYSLIDEGKGNLGSTHAEYVQYIGYNFSPIGHICVILTLTVLVMAIDALGHFKHDNYSIVGGNGRFRIYEVGAGTSSPILEHEGLKLQELSEIHPFYF